MSTCIRSCFLLVVLGLFAEVHGEALPLVAGVEFQPLAAQAQRVVQALDFLGEPLAKADRQALLAATREVDPAAGVQAIQEVLDKYVLVGVNINPESRVKAQPGEAARELMQQGWRVFLVKVHNEGGVTAKLQVESPNSLPLFKRAFGMVHRPKAEITPGDVPHRFLDVTIFDRQPLTANLSGLDVDYRILQLYCRDAGRRDVTLSFNVGQGTQDIGFRSDVSLLFNARRSTEVSLGVLDHDGTPTTASFIVRDRLRRVYPSQSRRLAPDFYFHPQVYRADGETILLPPGEYTIETTRGPEYLVQQRTISVPAADVHREEFRLARWVEPKRHGWYSGDHHVHGAGCKHYDNPTEGVTPSDMFRHMLGEDLNVACVLSWGPCWYFQKQYFEGKVSDLSQENHLMRYDVEVSGFPSSHAGHICLLNLKEDDYPGTSVIEDWPSWDLPIFRWAKSQGAVVGFAHSAIGLNVPTTELPNYIVPPFNGIGANEFIVDAPLGACDFISTVDTVSVFELNIWYHTLNCGLTARISGETDFPCIFGERVGIGRAYVKVDGDLNYHDWVQGIKQGRSYVSDGFSHLMDFKVNTRAVGEEASRLDLDKAGTVQVTARVAARLDEQPNEAIRNVPLTRRPYWHVEKARVGDTRKVPVEVVVNGYPVDRTEITADGTIQDVRFEVPIERSSWVALRILPSSHTNPVFVHVAGKPIRASRRSADWCLKSVERCWQSKMPQIRQSERAAARAAYDEAKQIYAQILAESTVE